MKAMKFNVQALCHCLQKYVTTFCRLKLLVRQIRSLIHHHYNIIKVFSQQSLCHHFFFSNRSATKQTVFPSARRSGIFGYTLCWVEWRAFRIFKLICGIDVEKDEISKALTHCAALKFDNVYCLLINQFISIYTPQFFLSSVYCIWIAVDFLVNYSIGSSMIRSLLFSTHCHGFKVSLGRY